MDIFPLLAYKGIEFFDTVFVLKRIQRHNGIQVACDADAYIIAFLKEFLANGRSKKNYLEEACKAYVNNEAEYDRILTKYFGTRMAITIKKHLFVNGDGSNLHLICRRARWSLLMKTLTTTPLNVIKKKVYNWTKRFGRLIRPPGTDIAILGTDGSGKSSIIDHIKPILEQALRCEVIYEHLRPNLLPSIACLFGKPQLLGPTTDPHASSPSSLIGSLMRLTYYTCDYVIGYWLKTYPALVKRSHVFVFDRYFYDYFIDPRRGRVSAPKWILQIFSSIIHKPDIILCLGAGANIIYSRKPELPITEITRQQQELRTFCDDNKNAYWIDTGCSIEDSINQSLKIITSKMASRYE